MEPLEDFAAHRNQGMPLVCVTAPREGAGMQRARPLQRARSFHRVRQPIGGELIGEPRSYHGRAMAALSLKETAGAGGATPSVAAAVGTSREHAATARHALPHNATRPVR